MQIISGGIHARYNDANNETIPWDDEDHCFAGTTYSTFEIVRYDIPSPSKNEEVLDRIVECLPDHELVPTPLCQSQPTGAIREQSGIFLRDCETSDSIPLYSTAFRSK